ncbi:hypothetical protein IE4771_CH00901 [Rhizobium etli bv. mimosae str. IE4771]|uniref:Uncharacterized protein n=1 Tax=Rhizobium etli bv. mimosae str. IE4771 TaxID=1432050 RepID=A0A060I2C8_RHIET|nr:hypothetical protein IE4771_CH00901 [Rhizobium sp. IE4771]
MTGGWIKTPPQTPPHKGEGLNLPHPFVNISAFRRECGGATRSPSPLWGGVGEGTLQGAQTPSIFQLH